MDSLDAAIVGLDVSTRYSPCKLVFAENSISKCAIVVVVVVVVVGVFGDYHWLSIGNIVAFDKEIPAVRHLIPKRTTSKGYIIMGAFVVAKRASGDFQYFISLSFSLFYSSEFLVTLKQVKRLFSGYFVDYESKRDTLTLIAGDRPTDRPIDRITEWRNSNFTDFLCCFQLKPIGRC